MTEDDRVDAARILLLDLASQEGAAIDLGQANESHGPRFEISSMLLRGVRIERFPLRSERSSRIIEIRDMGDVRGRRRLREFVQTIARLQKRERAICRDLEPNGREPAWTLRCHVLARPLLDHLGIGPDEVAGAGLSDRRIDKSRASLKAAVDGGQLQLEVRTPGATYMLTSEPRIVVEAPYPESVVVGRSGGLLADVVAHEAIIHAAPVRVETIRVTGRRTHIHIEDRHMWLADAPEGVERGWA